MRNELLLIVNPRAGRRRAVWDETALRVLLEPLGFDVSVRLTGAAGDAARLARDNAGRVAVIGVVGGDGTVHETVNGTLPHRTPIVIVPSGSGNDFSSLVACPRTPRELAEVLSDGWGADLDVIALGGRYCVNSAGLGFEGHVNRLSHGIAWLGGRTRYAAALLRALRTIRHPRFTITTSRGDEIAGETLLVSIGNGRRTGGAFRLTPGAFPDDGLIDVCVVRAMGLAKMLFILPRSFNGTHVKRPEVRMLRAESIVVESDLPYPMHVDGEYVEAPAGRLEMSVVPGALRVLCRRAGPNILSKPLRRIL